MMARRSIVVASGGGTNVNVGIGGCVASSTANEEAGMRNGNGLIKGYRRIPAESWVFL